jgi:hypothetical protein
MHEAAESAEWISLYLSPFACLLLDVALAVVAVWATGLFLKLRKSPRA